MLNLVIFKSVTGKDLPILLKCINNGITEPLEELTLPYLTTENFVFFFPIILFAEIKILSEQSFVAPYKFLGATALSVDKDITFLTLFEKQASIMFYAPKIFVFTNSIGLYSAAGTCFSAAA